MNSVVFGTSANNVTPKNFSSIPEPSNTASTTSTKSSTSSEDVSTKRPGRNNARTCDDRIERSAPQQHAGTRQPAPRRRIVSSMPTIIAVCAVKHSAANTKGAMRMHLLMAEGADGRHRHGAREVFSGHVVRQLCRSQAWVVDRVVDAFQDRRIYSGGWLRGRWVCIRNPPSTRGRCGRWLPRIGSHARDRRGLRAGLGEVYRPRNWRDAPRSYACISASKARFMLQDPAPGRPCGSSRLRYELMVQGHAASFGRVQELLRVLPYLRGVSAEGEPQAEEIGLEQTEGEASKPASS